MNQLGTCTNCEGYVPTGATTCPHCDAGSSLTKRLLTLAGGGAMAVTLMACYGMAPQYRHHGPPEPTTTSCDTDGDGLCAPEDCNDNDPGIHPGADDPDGDGIDQDCNGRDGAFAEAPETPTIAGE